MSQSPRHKLYVADGVRAALASLDERDLAARLNVSVLTLRRYRDETMPMTWVTHERLSAELARLATASEPARRRQTRVVSNERKATRAVRRRSVTA